MTPTVDEFAVRRYDGNGELVDLGEFGCLGIGRSRHPGQLVVEAEIVLEGDGGEGDVFLLDPDALSGLERLVEPVAVAAPGHEAPRELIDDDDLIVLDHVVHVPLEYRVGLEGLLHVVQEGDAGHVKKTHAGLDQPLAQQDLFGLLVTSPGKFGVSFSGPRGDYRTVLSTFLSRVRTRVPCGG